MIAKLIFPFGFFKLVGSNGEKTACSYDFD